MTAAFTITALCREFEVTPRTLRFYEDRGLLNPARAGQTRLYSAKDRARLGLILRGKRLGFSLGEIAELLDLYDPADGGAAQLARSIAAVDARIARLARQSLDIELVLSELRGVRAQMEQRRSELAQKPAPASLARADDYDRILRARVDGDPPALTKTR